MAPSIYIIIGQQVHKDIKVAKGCKAARAARPAARAARQLLYFMAKFFNLMSNAEPQQQQQQQQNLF